MKNTGKSDGRKITFEIDKKNGKHLQKTYKFSRLSQKTIMLFHNIDFYEKFELASKLLSTSL